MSHQHNNQGKLVLVIADDADMRSLLCDTLHEIGLQVTAVTDGIGAIEKITNLEPHAIVTDLRMPTGGFTYVRNLRARFPSCPIILLTTAYAHEVDAEVMACGVHLFSKPIRMKDLQQAVLALFDENRKPEHEG